MKSNLKYNNIKLKSGGMSFDSKKEYSRYHELLLLQRNGLITDLKRQIKFPLIVNDKLICNYIADFVYCENGKQIVEDVKSEYTKHLLHYRIKNKLLSALYGIDIKEV